MRKAIIIIMMLCVCACAHAQQWEKIPYGDFEQWTVRYIKESALLGGETKALYMIAETDTIYGPKYTRKNSPWSTGNAYAQALGMNKVSVSVVPERRETGGWCCRIENKMDTIKAVGIPLKAMVTGTIYTGELCDPVTLSQGSDPASAIDMGMPFTQRPKALVLDYKAKILNGQILHANASRRVQTKSGRDKGQIMLVLQHRWEKDGHIYAYRVGTASEYIERTTNGWVNDHRIEVVYGKTKEKNPIPWQDLSDQRIRTHNSHGQMVTVEEVGWRPDLQPTHMIIQISSGSQPAFTGCPGNIVWCDNIRIEN